VTRVRRVRLDAVKRVLDVRDLPGRGADLYGARDAGLAEGAAWQDLAPSSRTLTAASAP
jgi:hypothetical protein